MQKHPDWVLSALLMSDFYDAAGDPHEALRLIASLEPDMTRNTGVTSLRDMLIPLSHPLDSLSVETITVFTSNDTLSTIHTGSFRNTLLMFTDENIRKSDSIDAALSILFKNSSLGIVDISADPDTTTWHSSIDGKKDTDPAGMIRAWAVSPYNMPELQDIPVASLPWFILTDSTGTLIYRGPSISRVRSLLEK